MSCVLCSVTRVLCPVLCPCVLVFAGVGAGVDGVDGVGGADVVAGLHTVNRCLGTPFRWEPLPFWSLFGLVSTLMCVNTDLGFHWQYPYGSGEPIEPQSPLARHPSGPIFPLGAYWHFSFG